jgi:hypothetical protein
MGQGVWKVSKLRIAQWAAASTALNRGKSQPLQEPPEGSHPRQSRHSHQVGYALEIIKMAKMAKYSKYMQVQCLPLHIFCTEVRTLQALCPLRALHGPGSPSSGKRCEAHEISQKIARHLQGLHSDLQPTITKANVHNPVMESKEEILKCPSFMIMTYHE